jgi:hypothetical protein
MKTIFSIITLLSMILTISACTQKKSNMNSYSDGNGNAYFITETALQYSPVTPEESSSGEYSGGKPATVELTAEQYGEVMALFDAAFADTENQTEGRAKMTGVVEKDGKKVILKSGAATKANIENTLKNILDENPVVSETEATTVEGELLNTKGGPSVEGDLIP